MKIFWTLLAVVAVFALVIAAVAFGGLVDVAATSPDPKLLAGFLETTRENAIERAIADIDVPPLDDPRMLRSGLAHYHAMCVTCHGAPGVEPAELAQGLNPRPPRFGRPRRPGRRGELTADEAGERQRDHNAESYWIIKNGLRMTGMPAFGPTHDERELWAITAFVSRLRDLSPQDYAAMVANAGLEPAGGHEHGEDAEAVEGGATGEAGHSHGDATPAHGEPGHSHAVASPDAAATPGR